MKCIRSLIFTFLVLCLFSAIVSAQSTQNNTNTGGANTVAGTQSGNNDTIQTNSGIIVGGQPSGSGLSPVTLGGAGGSSKSKQSVNINTPKNTASAVAPTLFPTVPCFKGISAAA